MLILGAKSEEGGITDCIYNFDELAKLLQSLYLITGRKITLKGENFGDVLTSNTACGFCRTIQSTTQGYQKCIACDTKALTYARQQDKAYLYRCHAGLMEAAIPIMDKGRLVAYLMYGQVLDEPPTDEQWARVEKQCSWHSNLPELKKEFFRLDHLSQKTLWAYADVLSACASYIWLHKYVQQSQLTDAQRLSAFVEENYARPLTLESIAGELGVGKTKLCETARRELSCSVQQLVRRCRVAAAKQLLETSELSVSEIAEAVGIADSNYFVKTFKAITGQTPLHYKKQAQK